MTAKLSCVPMIYFRQIALDKTMSLAQWIEMLPQLGLAATEIHHRMLESYDPAYLASVARLAHEAGARVSQLISAREFTHPDAEARAEELRQLKRDIDAAAALGAASVRLTAGQAHPGVARSQGVGWVVDGFREALEHADKRGVIGAYENHFKDFFWEHPDFSARADIFLEIVDRLRDTSLMVNFDTSNPIPVGDDPLAILAEVQELVVNVHVKDREGTAPYRHTAVGEGVVDVAAIFSLLKRGGYDRWLSIEYNGDEGQAGLQRSIQKTAELWQRAR